MKTTTAEFLALCTRHYDALIEKMAVLRKSGSAEATLAWIEMVAGFAAMHHPGRFDDGRLENAALEIGADLPASRRERWISAPTAEVSPRPADSRRRVLHVTTLSTGYGGHARTILNWIKKDPTSRHSLVVTRQQNAPTFAPLAEAVAQSGGRLVFLPQTASIVEGGRWLRRFAAETADLVILHLVPNDVVPLVAFAAPGGPPVAQVHLCDQLFWLGTTVADLVINLRELSIATSRELRHTRNDRLLPIPLAEPERTVGRGEARSRLGIPDSQVMLLSVGRSVKYTPSTSHNFFRTAKAILDRHPPAHLYLVGVCEADHLGSPLFVGHERLHCIGPVDDVTPWQQAADVYLEGFPFGSQTALLESVLPGVPCVRVFAPPSPLLAAEDISVNEVVDYPGDEAEYVHRAGEFITDPDARARIGGQLRERVLHHHVGERWNRYLETIYDQMADLGHAPFAIPAAAGAARPVDLAIGGYHLSRYAGDAAGALERVVREGGMGVAYQLRQRGFHADALQAVRLAGNRRWPDRESMVMGAKILVHRLAYPFLVRRAAPFSLGETRN